MLYALSGLGDFSGARIQMQEVLKAAKFYKATGFQVQCLPGAALIAAGEGRLERAAELLALAFHHPAAATGWLGKFPLVTRLRQMLESELSEEVFAAAWERGKALDLDETVESLLVESTV
jgi:hypothetical protein